MVTSGGIPLAQNRPVSEGISDGLFSESYPGQLDTDPRTRVPTFKSATSLICRLAGIDLLTRAGIDDHVLQVDCYILGQPNL